jgi:ABC-2 type transport system ATP-binding protein
MSATARPEASVDVTCRAVTSGYLGSRVLQAVTFRIDAPAVYVVVGPNGAGKTTLFRTLAGILRPYEGEVRIGGAPAEHQTSRNHTHYLSHMDGLPDGLRVRAALEFYARAERAGPDDIERVVDLLGIRELSDRYPSQLSAGQRKRVSIARIFLREREVYLLDEPTTSLDPGMAREIRNLILKLSRDKVVLYSSHNLFEAREIGQYVLVLREGKLALFDQIQNLRGARYVVGVRLLDPAAELPGFSRQGGYFVRELPGPEAVPALVHELDAAGVKLREIREMDNPLEDLFT